MIPYSYNMVDMGGIDLAEANVNSPSELENPAVTREKPRGSPVIAR